VPRKPSPPDPLAVFGGRVRARRHELGWTLEQLGEASGLHWTYIGQVERGVRNLSLLNILKVAEALGVNPAAAVMPPRRQPERSAPGRTRR
jgi:transcriptional regulator with XRE-family HTH domain